MISDVLIRLRTWLTGCDDQPHWTARDEAREAAVTRLHEQIDRTVHAAERCRAATVSAPVERQEVIR